MQMKNVGHKWTVQDIPSQEGRLAVVTGATSGVGFYTAKAGPRPNMAVVWGSGIYRLSPTGFEVGLVLSNLGERECRDEGE